MRINWILKDKDWAFGNLCRHFIKKMPNHEHVIDEKDADVNYVCSPHFFKNRKAYSKTILHIDSNRWYEHLIKKEK